MSRARGRGHGLVVAVDVTAGTVGVATGSVRMPVSGCLLSAVFMPTISPVHRILVAERKCGGQRIRTVRRSGRRDVGRGDRDTSRFGRGAPRPGGRRRDIRRIRVGMGLVVMGVHVATVVVLVVVVDAMIVMVAGRILVLGRMRMGVTVICGVFAVMGMGSCTRPGAVSSA